MHRIGLVLLLSLAGHLAACGAGVDLPNPIPPGNAARGKELFDSKFIGAPRVPYGDQAPGCSTCHSLQPGVVLVGPSLAGIASRAGQTIQSPEYRGRARTAAEYVWESIVTPKSFLGKGAAVGGAMYEGFGQVLQKQDIADIVAFLISQ